MNNEKHNKKEKAKEIAKKVLHVICYILSALFILLMAVVGLQNCKKADGVSAESEQVHITDLTATSWRFNDTLALNFRDDYDINFDDDFSIQQSWNYTSMSVQDGSLIYWDSNGGRTIAYDYEDKFIYTPEARNIYIHSGEDVSRTSLIDFLYANAVLTNEVTDFIFNKTFNYNAPMNIPIEGVYGSLVENSYTTLTSVGAYVTINTGTFISNQQQFNRIRVFYTKSDATSVLINDEVKDAPTGFYVYVGMEYENTITNYSIFANIHDMEPFIRNGGYTKYYTNSSTWQVDAFRYITMLNAPTEQTRILLDMFNNNNQNAYNGSQVGTDMTNVFTLVGSAFTGLLPILSIYLLPGITLGTLLFIPLVATLVFVIIKVIKK